MKVYTVLLALVFLAACSGTESSYPLDVEGKGLTAIKWGMGPDDAVGHMLELEGLSKVRDTTYVLRRSINPYYPHPDTVKFLRLPGPQPPYKIVTLTGGEFLGNDVDTWNLYFVGEESLEFMTIRMPAPERREGKLRRIRSEFDRRYTKADTLEYGRSTRTAYVSAGIAGSKEATTSDTYAKVYDDQYIELINISYEDKARMDSLIQEYSEVNWEIMHVSEFNKMMEEGK